MRQLNDIAKQRDAMGVMVELSSVFEGIASIHIAQIKDQVLSSEKFFNELWQIYRQIRVDPLFHFGRETMVEKPSKKQLLILITAEGGFSGDIDQRLIKEALSAYKPDVQDIIVVGQHGANQLTQAGVSYIKSFKLPSQDFNFNTEPLVAQIQNYNSTIVFFPRYKSLSNQEITNMELRAEVAERGKSVKEAGETISESNYIFEPSVRAVVDHLEKSMTQIMVSEIILQSKLAQYANRFLAMHAAHDRASDSYDEINTLYNRAHRRYKDERSREIINGLRKASV